MKTPLEDALDVLHRIFHVEMNSITQHHVNKGPSEALDTAFKHALAHFLSDERVQREMAQAFYESPPRARSWEPLREVGEYDTKLGKQDFTEKMQAACNACIDSMNQHCGQLSEGKSDRALRGGCSMSEQKIYHFTQTELTEIIKDSFAEGYKTAGEGLLKISEEIKTGKNTDWKVASKGTTP